MVKKVVKAKEGQQKEESNPKRRRSEENPLINADDRRLVKDKPVYR